MSIDAKKFIPFSSTGCFIADNIIFQFKEMQYEINPEFKDYLQTSLLGYLHHGHLPH